MGRGERIDWSPVWEEVGQLYNDKVPLSQIRNRMENLGFQASIRAYRSRFEQLGMTKLMHVKRQTVPEAPSTRPSITELHAAERSPAVKRSIFADSASVMDMRHTSKRRRLDYPVDQDEVNYQVQSPPEWTLAASGDIVATTPDAENRHASLSVWTPMQDGQVSQNDLIDAALALGTDASTSLQENSETVGSSSDQLSGQEHDVYEHFLLANSQELELTLTATEFEQGITSVLHRAAEKNWGILSSVIRFMQYHAIPIDMLDEKGLTALHLTIKSGHIESAQELLAAGASISRQGSTTALHVAVQAAEISAVIFGELLHRKAKVYAVDDKGSTSLGVLVDRIEHYGQYELGSKELTSLLGKTKTLLNVGGAASDEHDRAAFETFVNWCELVYNHGPPLEDDDDLIAVMDAFQATGYSPLWSMTIKSCSFGYCRNLAEYAAFHYTNTKIWRSIIRSPGLEGLALGLAELLLSPCDGRHRGADPAGCMRILLDRSPRLIKVDAVNLLHQLLRNTRADNSKDNQTILQLWLDRGVVKDVGAVHFGKRPLQSYLQRFYFGGTGTPHLGLIMTLLLADEGLSTVREAPLGELHDCLFCYHPSLYYERYVELEYGQHLMHYHAEARSSLDSEYLFRLVKDSWRSVLHVLTAHLIMDDLPPPHAKDKVSRILFASMTRKECKLPQLPIDHDTLMKAIDGGLPGVARQLAVYEGRWYSLKTSLWKTLWPEAEYNDDVYPDKEWT